jgi:hypothetical protein
MQGAEGGGGGPEGDAAARGPARPPQGEALRERETRTGETN